MVIRIYQETFQIFNLKLDSSRIYARVKVGYDKVDYECLNGRDEFRFTAEYTTGCK